ncbi:hypothetical protein L6452_44289 [Arctium lappa]|uniref:Uncharacterized protein n=1 Tax=Arctium lappa TaxID=4217 RepID=A0ACB8XFQ6_ARCLA|nr:hypothetical protein L6452_44289 [Arctium lappa]
MKVVNAIYPFAGPPNEGDEVKRKRRGGKRWVLRISAVVPPLCCKSEPRLQSGGRNFLIEGTTEPNESSVVMKKWLWRFLERWSQLS